MSYGEPFNLESGMAKEEVYKVLGRVRLERVCPISQDTFISLNGFVS